jgi:uncharacterized membrane-anchored protein
LFGYLVKGAYDTGRFPIDPSIATAAFVPLAAFSIWWTVRSIRKRHISVEGED